jgi:putative transcriptional regulator
MTINHHLDEATLMSFAAGSLPNTLAAVAAAHIAMCEHCRSELAVLERIGAALVADLPPASMQRAQPELPPVTTLQPARSHAAHKDVPAPLAGVIGDGLDQVRWRWIGPGLWHRPVRVRGAGSLQLIKASPGAGVPEHTHGGSELTLVLRGALIDSTGRYAAGDVSDLDEDVEHTPVADAATGCICIIATEQRTRFKGVLARLLQPWHGL